MERKSFSISDFRVFEKPVIDKSVTPFSDSQEVYEYFDLVAKSDREMFICFFLDAKNRLIKDEIHSIGTVDTSAVYPREIFKSAFIYNATSIICIHNHPSGNPQPSESDDQITQQIILGAIFLNFKILDHIIVGESNYFSYADHGLIEDFEIKAKQINNSI